MDILYITKDVENRLKDFCSEDLIRHVFNNFEKHAMIIIQEEHQKPSKIWNVSDYIRDKSINIIDKMNVVLSFIASGGIIQINNTPYFDIYNSLAFFKKMGLINDEQLEILSDPWLNYHYKQLMPHFDLIR